MLNISDPTRPMSDGALPPPFLSLSRPILHTVKSKKEENYLLLEDLFGVYTAWALGADMDIVIDVHRRISWAKTNRN